MAYFNRQADKCLRLVNRALAIFINWREERVSLQYLRRLMETRGDDDYALRAMIEHAIGRRIYKRSFMDRVKEKFAYLKSGGFNGVD